MQVTKATNPDSYRDHQVHNAFLFAMRHRNSPDNLDKYRGGAAFYFAVLVQMHVARFPCLNWYLSKCDETVNFLNLFYKGTKQKKTMNNITFGVEYLKELEAEAAATRKCVERVPESLYEWRPHEKSMTMGYLTHLVAEIPNWITHMIIKSEIDFATYPHFKAASAAELAKHFDENMESAKKALKDVTNDQLKEPFYLKHKGQVVFTSSKKENISSSINHMVHHRGQLTVYLRLNNLPVPSIYGPSADDKAF